MFLKILNIWKLPDLCNLINKMRRFLERLYGLAKEGADRSDGVMSVLDGLIDLRAPTGTN